MTQAIAFSVVAISIIFAAYQKGRTTAFVKDMSPLLERLTELNEALYGEIKAKDSLIKAQENLIESLDKEIKCKDKLIEAYCGPNS